MAKKRVAIEKKDSGKSGDKTGKSGNKFPKIIIWLIVIAVIVILIVVFANQSKKGGGGGEKPGLTTCELNNHSCYNGTSCPLGYAEVDMGCKTGGGQVCCKKIPTEPEKSQCERAGLDCYTKDCPGGYAEIDLFCGIGKVCCKKIIVEDRTKCELQSFQCFTSSLPEPQCPMNYMNVNLSCRTGEVCCKQKAQQNKTFVVYGYVRVKEGNCMPPIGPNCTTTPLFTEVAIFPKTSETQMSGNYFRTAAGPIKMTMSNLSGYYQMELPYGEYSVFAKDPQNNDYYCNSFGYGNFVCYVDLINSKQFDILIDHSTQ